MENENNSQLSTLNSPLVPPGYKQTEVGVIPEDWECTSVGQLAQSGVIHKPMDGNHGNIHPKSGDFVSFGIPFVMANNVRNGSVDLSNCSFIRKEQADSLQKGFSLPGDVLLTHKATIGNTAMVGEIPFEYIMLTPQVTYYRVADRKRLNNWYLRHYFDSASFQKILISLSGGGTRAYIGITAQLQLPVVVPPLSEQEAIAEALSDADAFIESLEQLITKKRHLKQGAMQELLTGKRRLPGFANATIGYKQTEIGMIPEDWEVATLNTLSSMKSGEGITSANIDQVSPYPCYGGNGLRGFTTRFTHDGSYALIGRQGALCGNVIGVRGKFFASEHAIVVTPSSRTDIRWLTLVLGDMRLNQYSESSAQPGLSVSKILDLKVACPSTKAEQEAIAKILSDIDAEIDALESKLAKYRQIKQGMMHVLLTGQVRLV